MSVDTPATHPELPPSDASARPPPPRRPSRGRWLIGGAVLGLLVVAVAVLVAGDQLRRSSETVTAVDGEVRQLVVETTGGDLQVSVADAPQVTVTEHRTPWARATNTSTLEDGVLHLSSTCTSWLVSCSVDHHVELPPGLDVQVHATAGDVHLIGVGDVDVELVAGGITIAGATGASVVTRTETGDTSIQTDNPPELVDATATMGEVTITVPDAAYRVDAATEVGRVDVSVDQDADAPGALRARTVTGKISIQPVASGSLLPSAPAAAEATQAEPSQFDSPEALEAFLDDVMADHFDRFDLAGASITVVKDGELWVSKGYGHADVAAGTPVEADATLFPTASVAKLFTWTAVMQLVERGELDLDAEVNSYLSAFQIPDNFAEPVRVRHLLGHTAGFEDKPMSLLVRPEDLTDLETALVRDMPAQDWEPGRYTAYSNYSAALAGHLVAEVSGRSWEDYLDGNILEPLGMTRTSPRQPTPENREPGMTKVYSSNAGEHLEAGYEIVSLAPVGGMVATTEDMGRFMLAHLQGGRVGEARILEEATAQQMHSQLFTHDPRLAGNAHGFWESTENGQRILSHGGDHNTSMTWLGLLPDHDLGLYVAYNSDRGAQARGELWEAFLDHGFPVDAPSAPEPAAVTQGDIERFAGTYGANRVSSTTPAKLFNLLGVMTVSAEDGTLVTDVGGPEPQRWVPAGENEFAAVDGDARMIFDDDGARPSHVFFDGPPVAAYSPLGAWVATPWYDRAVLHGGLLAASLLLILSALVLWPVLAVLRRRKATRPPGTGGARWWAAATGGLYLLSVVLVVASLLDYMALEYGPTPLFVAALTAGVAAAVLTAGAVVHTFLAWRNGHWSMAGRVHYTLVTLAFVTFAWQLNHWNLLGFHA